jgi:hypothetical protein
VAQENMDGTENNGIIKIAVLRRTCVEVKSGGENINIGALFKFKTILGYFPVDIAEQIWEQ